MTLKEEEELAPARVFRQAELRGPALDMFYDSEVEFSRCEECYEMKMETGWGWHGFMDYHKKSLDFILRIIREPLKVLKMD